MKTTAAFLSLVLSLFAVPGEASADSCAQIAQSLASSRGAQVLQVRAVNQGGQVICEVTLRTPGQGGQPPRVETVRVNG